MSGLEWEIKWINNHIDRYDSPQHAQAVINSIIKRYWIQESIRLVKAYEANPITLNKFALFDHYR